jgi:exopolyphosphatase/guanosine-5'-triphosphate,3'-diphosphate pyrophosphatase
MKIASIDIGTNTVILLIAEIINNRIVSLRNEYRIPRIGKSLIPGNNISENKIHELITILLEFSDLIKVYNCEIVLATATNAFRISQNASDIIKRIQDATRININVVADKKEAEYSFMGAISDLSDGNKDNIVIDIGGGSTEIIQGNVTRIKYLNSFQAGVVSGTEGFLINDPPLSGEIKTFETFLTSTFKNLNLSGFERAIAIAGTPTTLACIQKGLIAYNEDEVEGSILKQDDVYKLKEELSGLSSNEIREKYRQVVADREDVILAGTIILYKLMKILNLSEVLVSTKGIRYGAIIDYINKNY